jgi:hypothetical protein
LVWLEIAMSSAGVGARRVFAAEHWRPASFTAQTRK